MVFCEARSASVTRSKRAFSRTLKRRRQSSRTTAARRATSLAAASKFLSWLASILLSLGFLLAYTHYAPRRPPFTAIQDREPCPFAKGTAACQGPGLCGPHRISARLFPIRRCPVLSLARPRVGRPSGCLRRGVR